MTNLRKVSKQIALSRDEIEDSMIKSSAESPLYFKFYSKHNGVTLQ